MIHMTDERIYVGFLSGNILKIIACIAMLIDHIGWILLPELTVLRMIGRISMPLFAFTFGEGCFYTRSKAKHFVLVFAMGVITSAAMSFAMGELYGNILITFSMSCLIICALDGLKRSAFAKDGKKAALCSVALALSVALAAWVCCFSPFDIDYGIAGVTLPVCVRLFDFRSFGAQGLAASAYNLATVLLPFFVNLLALSLIYGAVQLFSLFSLIFILCYSGGRGRHKFKGLFYIFYPAHLAIIASVYLILNPGFLTTLF